MDVITTDRRRRGALPACPLPRDVATVQREVVRLAHELTGVPRDEIGPDDDLADLGLDSMDDLDLRFQVEALFEVPIPDSAEFATVRDLVDFVAGAPAPQPESVADEPAGTPPLSIVDALVVVLAGQYDGLPTGHLAGTHARALAVLARRAAEIEADRAAPQPPANGR